MRYVDLVSEEASQQHLFQNSRLKTLVERYAVYFDQLENARGQGISQLVLGLILILCGSAAYRWRSYDEAATSMVVFTLLVAGLMFALHRRERNAFSRLFDVEREINNLGWNAHVRSDINKLTQLPTLLCIELQKNGAD